MENNLKILLKCSNCNEVLPLSSFVKNKNCKNDHENRCINCKKQQQNQWYQNNKEITKQRAKKWKKNNKNRVLELNKNWRKNNPEKTKESSKKYYENNLPKMKKKGKQFRKNNPDYQKNYYQKHKNIINKQQVEKRNNNVEDRMLHNLRTRLNKALKGNPKYNTTMKLVACSIKFLKKHLEKQFTLKMNWDNYGKGKYWELDHIIPCSSFDLSNLEEQIKCFHYSNLQPLTVKDNRAKGKKLFNYKPNDYIKNK